MKIFTCQFRGHYPIGAVALILAESKLFAKALLETELERVGLDQEISLNDITEVSNKEPKAIILLDGDY